MTNIRRDIVKKLPGRVLDQMSDFRVKVTRTVVAILYIATTVAVLAYTSSYQLAQKVHGLVYSILE